MNQLPPEVLVKIIGVMFYLLAGCVTVGLGVFGFFHRGLIKRLDAIDADLKPTLTRMALQEQRGDIHTQRLNDYDKRISALEAKLKDK